MHAFHRATIAAMPLAIGLMWAPALARGLEDQFVIGLEQQVADGIPGAGAGNLEAPGATDVYTFTADAGTVVYFDEQGAPGCAIFWSCRAPDRTMLFQNNAMCIGDVGTVVLPLSGAYTITVYSNTGGTGTYSFTLWEVDPPDVFAIDVKDVVSNGSPGPGAGNLEEPGAIDEYTFEGQAGQAVYFDEQGAASCPLLWSCEAPDATLLFNNNPLCSSDPGTIILPQTGTYTIRAYSGNSGAVGTYSFTIWQVNAVDSFEIALKQSVSNGVPGPGAGNLEEPGAVDQYTFQGEAGQTVYFDEQGDASCSLLWSCEAPDATLLFNNNPLCVGDPGPITLPQTGTYTIRVDSGNTGGVGTYSFTLWEVDGVQVFPIALKQVVSDGVPGPGAGNLEEPGAIDQYTFSVAPGTIVFFDELTSSDCAIVWSCQAPDETMLFANNALCSGDPGEFTLDQAGTYTITVHSGTTSVVGTYSFVLVAVNPTDSFTIELERTISDGVPAPGAGNIEEPGAVDQYTFTADAGTLTYFDELDIQACGLLWSCTAPSGAILFADDPLCAGDPGTIVLPETGDYVIRVAGVASTVGTYSFVVWQVNDPQLFTIDLDEVVSLDSPGPGAGFLEEPAASDKYTLDVAPGTSACFEALAGPCTTTWSCTDVNGEAIFANTGLCATDPGKKMLTLGGAYTITVTAGAATGEYAFIVHTGRAADIDGDCRVGVEDLLLVINNWGACADPNACPADVNGDEQVNVGDLLLVILDWG